MSDDNKVESKIKMSLKAKKRPSTALDSAAGSDNQKADNTLERDHQHAIDGPVALVTDADPTATDLNDADGVNLNDGDHKSRELGAGKPTTATIDSDKKGDAAKSDKEQNKPAFDGKIASDKTNSAKSSYKRAPTAKIPKEQGSKKYRFGLFTPFFLLIIVLIALGFIIHYILTKNEANSYYVESSVSIPSDNETVTSLINLNACIVDKSGTPMDAKKAADYIKTMHTHFGYEKLKDEMVQNYIGAGCDLDQRTISINYYGAD